MPFVPALPGSDLPAQEAQHLILAFAARSSPEAETAPAAPPASATVHLRELIRSMRVRTRETGDAHSLSPPHERLLARELGLAVTDGLVPWAAWTQARRAGSAEGPWGFITLCHWAMGREHATLSDPEALQLTEAESQALMSDMRPYFESEGITLHALTPGCWLAQGQALALPTASLDRVMAVSYTHLTLPTNREV